MNRELQELAEEIVIDQHKAHLACWQISIGQPIAKIEAEELSALADWLKIELNRREVGRSAK